LYSLIKKYLVLLLCLLAFSSTVFAFNIKTGYYVGTGVGKSISGLGFQPDLVIVKTDGAQRSVWRSSVMTGDESAYFDFSGGVLNGCITSLDGDGFTLGTDAKVNYNTLRYTWVAIGGSGGSDFKVGSYTGTGVDNLNIAGIGFQPDMVWVKRKTTSYTFWLTSVMTPDATSYFAGGIQVSNRIQALIADGFQVGNSSDVNTGGEVHYYVAFKASSNFAVGSYEGNGTDNRSITVEGFAPEFCFVKSSSTDVAVLRTDRSYGDETQYFTSTANTINNIQSFEANGFQVGTDTKVNAVGRKFYYALFKGASIIPPTSAFKMRTGWYMGNGTGQVISVPGFNPQYIMVKSDDANYGAFVTPYTGDNNTAYYAYAGAGFAEGIKSYSQDGFTLGSSTTVNTNGSYYRWVAFTGDSSANFVTGAYTGTGGDNRSINGLGFQPDFVAIKANGGYLGVFRTSSMTGDLTNYFSATANASNRIQALEADGFQVGSTAEVNAAGVLYNYIAFKETSGQFDVGSYTGNGADDRSITGLGFRPGSAWVKRTAASAGVLRSNNVTGDWGHYFVNTARAANLIQSLDADGFQIGNNASVNTNTSTYHYAAWKADPTSLTFEVQPATSIAGQSITPAVQVAVLDSLGNIDTTDISTTISITIESNPGSGVLSGISSKTVVGGIATFEGLSINKAGNGYTLRISASDLDPATSEAFNLTAAPAAYFGVTGEASMTAGGSNPTTLTAYDEFGNLATGYSGDKNIIFAGANVSTDPITNPTCRNAYGTDEAFGTASVINFSSGVATALMKLYSAEAAHICASQEAIGTPTSLILTVEVAAATKNKLRWETEPATSVYAGAIWTPFAVEILDAYGNRTVDTSSVYISPSVCSLEGTTVKNAVAGLAAYLDITYYDTAEALTLSATSDGVTGTGASDLINIHFATVEALRITGSSTMSAGASQTITVLSCDLNGNPAINYNGDKNLVFSGANPSTNPTTEPTCLDKNSSAVAFGSNTLLNFNRGRATAAMKLYKSEAALITAVQGTLETTLALSVEVSGGARNRIEWIAQPPSSVMAGATWESFEVGCLDSYGNRSADNGTITILPSSLTLLGTTTRQLVAGVVAFEDISCASIGTISLSATTEGAITSEASTQVAIGFGPKYMLGILTHPSTAEINSVITPSVEVTIKNQYGIVMTNENSTEVIIAINNNPSSGHLSGTTSETSVSGVTRFADLSINQWGNGYTLIASSEGLISASSNAFDINRAPAAKLVFGVQPADSIAGNIITPEVRIYVQDRFGNTMDNDSTTRVVISIQNNPSTGTIFGTLTQTASAGVVAFNDLYINRSGSGYTLLVSAEGLTIATSDAFTISGEMVRPTILTVSPSNDAINISPEAVVRAQFSQNMDSSVTLNAFTLKAIRDNSGNSIDMLISGTATFDALSRNFTFTPSASLTKGYTYQASFDASARNTDLITLLSAESWSFVAVFDHTRENIIYSSDRNAYVDLGTQTLPFDGSVAINRSPRTSPLYVNPTAITTAINKVLAEGNPFHYPVESSITEFALYDASGTHVSTRFAESAILALHYDDLDGDGFVDSTLPALRETDLLLYRLDETNSLWVRVPDSAVNAASNYVYAPVNTFSVYTIMSTPALDLSSAYSFPNPFKPSSGHTIITFTNLAAQCTIRIYSVSGELVKTIQETDGDGQKTWDVKNESGEGLRSGLYLYVISSSADTKKGKLVVVR